jgi:hypothetical protein
VLYPLSYGGAWNRQFGDILCCFLAALLLSIAKWEPNVMKIYDHRVFGRRVCKSARLAGFIFAMFNFFSCSSNQKALSITMYHPETKQTLTCNAHDKLARSESSMLATAVESCAKNLEQHGFIRK